MDDPVPEVITEDRAAICDIISEMLDEPDGHGIYRTTRAYNKLEDLLKAARMQALGWTWTEACIRTDEGQDIRRDEIPSLIERIERDLNPPAPSEDSGNG